MQIRSNDKLTWSLLILTLQPRKFVFYLLLSHKYHKIPIFMQYLPTFSCVIITYIEASTSLILLKSQDCHTN